MLSQFLLNGVISASSIMLVGISFGIIYRIAGFFHFAHGAVFTGGAYFTFLFSKLLNLPFYISIFLALVFSTLLGCLMELAVYHHLRRKGTSSLVFLLASLGFYVVLQNIISLIFGDDTKTIRSGMVEEGINILGARITPIQITIIAVSLLLFVSCFFFLKYTKMGQAMRAIANDSELASISGIETDQVILFTFALGSALAGIAGILVALDVDMTPTMGMNALLMGVVAVIIGGVGSIPGIALGALFLGMAQQFGVWKISSQWQDAIAFVILLIFLLFRPQGFLGKKVKTATL